MMWFWLIVLFLLLCGIGALIQKRHENRVTREFLERHRQAAPARRAVMQSALAQLREAGWEGGEDVDWADPSAFATLHRDGDQLFATARADEDGAYELELTMYEGLDRMSVEMESVLERPH